MTAASINDIGVLIVSTFVASAFVYPLVSSAYSITTINKVYDCFCTNITNKDCKDVLDKFCQGISISDPQSFCTRGGITNLWTPQKFVLVFSILGLIGAFYLFSSSAARTAKKYCYREGGYQQV